MPRPENSISGPLHGSEGRWAGATDPWSQLTRVSRIWPFRGLLLREVRKGTDRFSNCVDRGVPKASQYWIGSMLIRFQSCCLLCSRAAQMRSEGDRFYGSRNGGDPLSKTGRPTRGQQALRREHRVRSKSGYVAGCVRAIRHHH